MNKNDIYGPIADSVWHKASQLKMLICDVDGVFSDGRIYLGNNGEELKAFHTKDGFGIKALINAGIEVAIITGRKSTIVENRMRALGVKLLYQGCENKVDAFNDILAKRNVSPQECAYIGDDVVDLAVMKLCGLSVAVNDAHPYVIRHCDYTTYTKGGFGAVRELADIILLSTDNFVNAQGMSV